MLLWFAAGQAHAQATTTTAAVPAGGGAATCLKCHDEAKVVPILKTPHAVSGDPHSPFGQEGCESCHGPSGSQVASRSNAPNVVFKGPKTSPVPERNAQCLTYHQSGLRMNWQGSQHQRNDIACNDCHTIHISKDPCWSRSPSRRSASPATPNSVPTAEASRSPRR